MEADGYEHIGDEAQPAVVGRRRRNMRRLLGLGYMMATASCGMLLMGFNSTLGALAVNCGTSSVEVGTVFIAMAGGTGVGVLISPVLYRSFHGNLVISVALLVLAGCVISAPFVSTVFLLHVGYLMWGALFDTIITGCQIMTRKIHGEEAGVWMTANLVTMGMSSAIVTVIFLLNDSLLQRYAILSGWCFFAAFFVGFVLPVPESTGLVLDQDAHRPVKGLTTASLKPIDGGNWMGRCLLFIRTYSVELHMSVIITSVIGGQSATTTYLDTFVQRITAISDSQETLLMVDLWVAAAIGLVGGLWDQHRCTVPSLYRHTTVALLSGGAAGTAMLVFRHSSAVVWVCMAVVGLSYGPTVGYCYELYNRISVPSETGMAIVTFGVSFGSPAVPYAMSLVLDNTTSAVWFLSILVLTRLVPYPLLLNARRIAESKKRCNDGPVASGGRRPSSALPHSDEAAPLLL